MGYFSMRNSVFSNVSMDIAGMLKYELGHCTWSFTFLD
jgi:hypothetical protein